MGDRAGFYVRHETEVPVEENQYSKSSESFAARQPSSNRRQFVTKRKDTPMLRNFFGREDLARRVAGQTMAEYALLLALIALIVIASLTPLGTAISQLFADITAAL
jgi:Flp pilus assembly pilin Flp